MVALRLGLILLVLMAAGAGITLIYNFFYQRAINRRLANGGTEGRRWPSPIVIWVAAVLILMVLLVAFLLFKYIGTPRSGWSVEGFCTAEHLEEDGVTVGELTGEKDPRTIAELAENGFQGCDRMTGSDADFDYECFLLPENGAVIRAIYKGDLKPVKFAASLRIWQGDLMVASGSGIYRQGASESGVYYFFFGSSKGNYRYEMDFQLFTAEDLEGFASPDKVLEAIYGDPAELASASGSYNIWTD